MVRHYETIVTTKDEYDTAYIGGIVKGFVADSGIKNGIVAVVTAHTNCGITVTEPLPCILSDLEVLLHKLVDDDAEYSHAHFLPMYGRTSANAYGHLRSILVGNHTILSLVEGKLVMGEAQEVVFMEFDGPQARKIFVDIVGE
ncbi:Secondary thiamine-phosphate synthase enzyme [Ruminococcaceae bacterium BL-6]|nr:Secondary thiamine-phosphate synthase enzyme [Ruminococcaceae bacterium BL-6]